MLEGEHTSGTVDTCQALVDRSPNLPPRTARAAEVAYDAVSDSRACRQGEDGYKYFRVLILGEEEHSVRARPCERCAGGGDCARC